MIITWEGTPYDLDLQAITLQQAIVIQNYCGLPVVKLIKTIVDAPDESPELLRAVGAVHWLMLAQSGVKTPIADVDFALFKFLEALLTGLQAEAAADAKPEAEAGPDPTKGLSSPAPSASPPAPASQNGHAQGQGVVTASTTVS